MNLKELRTYCREQMSKNPDLSEEIRDIYYLAVSEVDEGGSETHECELAYNDISYLIGKTPIKSKKL